MRTKYFADNRSFAIFYWRKKAGSNRLEYYNGVNWYPSARKETGVCHDGEGKNTTWRQITRDEARKINGKGFRK